MLKNPFKKFRSNSERKTTQLPPDCTEKQEATTSSIVFFRTLLKALLISIPAIAITMAAREVEAVSSTNSFDVNTLEFLKPIESNFLNPNQNRFTVLDDTGIQPYLWFCTSTPTNHTDSLGFLKPSEIYVFQFAANLEKMLAANAKSEKSRTRKLAKIKERLQKYKSILSASKSDNDEDAFVAKYEEGIEAMEKIIEDIKNAEKFHEKWQELADKMKNLVQRIKDVVNKEATMGINKKRCAKPLTTIAQANVNGDLMFETRNTSEQIKSDDFDEYLVLPEILKPSPYNCFTVDVDRNIGPSTLVLTEKLEEKIKEHISAAMQRFDVYGGAEITAKAKSETAIKNKLNNIASASRGNDQIITDWSDILKDVIQLKSEIANLAGESVESADEAGRCLTWEKCADIGMVVASGKAIVSCSKGVEPDEAEYENCTEPTYTEDNKKEFRCDKLP